MCRSILTLRDTDAGETEFYAAALQYVRKISGYRKPSQANTVAFDAAVDEIALASAKLVASLQTRKATPSSVV